MSFMMPLLWVTVHFQGEGKGSCYLGCYHHTHIYILCLLSPPHLGTLHGPLLSGSGQVQLAVPGAYEKPQVVPLQPPVEAGPPATFTFHVNPMLHSRLHMELGEKLTVLQVSEPTDGLQQVMASARWSSAPGPPCRHVSCTLRGSMPLSSLQSSPSAEVEAESSKSGEQGILLSSLTLGQEEQHSVALEEVRLGCVRDTCLLCDL